MLKLKPHQYFPFSLLTIELTSYPFSLPLSFRRLSVSPLHQLMANIVLLPQIRPVEAMQHSTELLMVDFASI